METYSVTVNGVTYDVQVEKRSGNAAQSAPVQQTVPAVSAPPQQQASKPAFVEAGVKITAGAAGKIWKVVVKVGQKVKAGDPIVILEAMKMEIPIVAPQDGTIAQILASEGAPVEAGDLLATMN